MQTIELFIKDEDEDGVFAISLVDEPAIESDFLALSKQNNSNKFNIKLKEIDKKRKVVVGYALIPDLEIPVFFPIRLIIACLFFSVSIIVI